MALGNGKLPEPHGASLALTVPRKYFAPDALDAVYSYAGRFSRFRRTTQSMRDFGVKFVLLRRKAEFCMQPRGASLAACMAALCVQKASLSCAATAYGGLGIVEITRQMRRLPGLMGGSGRPGIFSVEDGDVRE